MQRRSFLALIGSAPLAALVRLPAWTRVRPNFYKPSGDQLRLMRDLQRRYNAAQSAHMELIVVARADWAFIAGEQW